MSSSSMFIQCYGHVLRIEPKRERILSVAITNRVRQLRITKRMAPEALVDTAGASLDIHITMSASASASASAAADATATNATKKTINLLRGWPSPALLPAGLLSGAAQRLLADPAVYVPALQYGPDAGYQPLREGLARWLGRHYGVTPDAGRICITGGASQSVACVLQSFTDPVATRAVWVVAPCYHLMCPILEDAGFAGRLRATPEDEEGMDLDALERKIRDLEEREKDLPPTESFKGDRPGRKLYRHVIYVVATCSNPSGKTMSLRRREGLVRLARKYDALIISDDVYDFLQWPISGALTPERPPEMRVPRLCDIDLAMGFEEGDTEGFGNAISNGSFSKIAGPGVRTGWVEASPAFVKGLSMTGSSRSGGAPSQMSAAILSDLVHSGELEKHIETAVRPGLQRRHRIAMDAIHRYIAPFGALVRESSLLRSHTYGGYFIWLTLDMGIQTKVIAEAALEEENLIIGSGDMFEVHGDEASAKFDSAIRLCFAWEPEEDLVEGIRRLGDLLHRTQQDKGRYEAQASRREQDKDYVNAIK